MVVFKIEIPTRAAEAASADLPRLKSDVKREITATADGDHINRQ